ncbi:ABC transporter permease [Paenibacillus thermotolerans]|uniref:ABC transporter permease n=1 Tax=Paenibacillus thermotolerans TaxID=3027807 RepID=UPI002367B863|nr:MULTISPECIES: ABC transporter permease subunit [unclassified Paenibacillus]
MNKTLLAGLMITGFMLLIAAFGPMFAPHELTDQATIEFVVKEDGSSDIIAPPVPPGNYSYPLGTDKLGYDILTQLLYGAKYTILAAVGIAFARVAIGGTIGMLLGYTSSGKKGWQMWSLLGGIPMFIIVWFFLAGITFNPGLDPVKLTMLMGVVFLLVGLPSVIGSVKDKAFEIKNRQFVLASRSIGSGHWTIVRSHLFPHLKESMLILFVNEIILILALFGQLGLFRIFIGGTRVTCCDPVEYSSITKEWAGLISSAKLGIYINQWTLFIPLAAYVLLILGFYCVSKGLESKYKEKYSKAAHV